jgi:hypothetical protein
MKSSREVKKTIEVDVQEDVITLTLSKDEAETLSEITFRHVSGSSTDSPRQHSDAIHEALRAAGVDQHALAGHARGRIHFEDYPEPEKPTKDRPVKVGDRIKILKDRPSYAQFMTGDIATVVEIDGDYAVQAENASGLWWVKVSEFERVSD